jgi:hypothetical protein
MGGPDMGYNQFDDDMYDADGGGGNNNTKNNPCRTPTAF